MVRHGPRSRRNARRGVRGTNSWNQVCQGGLVMGALAIADAEPALAAQVVARAVDEWRMRGQ